MKNSLDLSKRTLFVICCILFGMNAMAGSFVNNATFSDISVVRHVAQAGKTVKGVVTDQFGPVVGANVLVKGTTNGVITDIDGSFTLNNVPDNAVIQVSFIGYVTQEIKVAGKTNFEIKLNEDSNALEEVVVVGYGTMKKQDLTGTVSSIKGGDMEKQQRQTIQDMLRTGVAGLSVGMETDAKGNTAMLIRGKGSIGASTDPLLVLDGVIYSGQMTDINPNDIERVDVLKDASSTAVYGAQAANGCTDYHKERIGKQTDYYFQWKLGMDYGSF